MTETFWNGYAVGVLTIMVINTIVNLLLVRRLCR